MEVVDVAAIEDHHHNHEVILQTPTKSKGKTFTLETYLHFLHSHDFSNFTTAHLNLVISIHGFRKYKTKNLAEEALKGIELIDPVRSTLNEDISSPPPKASITYVEALKDLKSLNWQECSITSIRTIKQRNVTDHVIKRQKTVKKRPLASLNDIAPLMSESTSYPSKSDGSSTYSIVPVFHSKVAKKMRSAKGITRASSMSGSSGPSNSSTSEF